MTKNELSKCTKNQLVEMVLAGVALSEEFSTYKEQSRELIEDLTKQLASKDGLIVELNEKINELRRDVVMLDNELNKHLPQGDVDQYAGENDSPEYSDDTTDDYGMPSANQRRERLLDLLCRRIGITERTNPIWNELQVAVNGDLFKVWFNPDVYGTAKQTNRYAHNFLGKLMKHANDCGGGVRAFFGDRCLQIRTTKREFV